MRPKSVKLGEQLYAASLVLAVVLAAMSWRNTVLMVGTAAAVGTIAFSIGLAALALIFASRAGSRIALWILTAITGLTVIVFLQQVSGGYLSTGLFGVLTTMQMVLGVVAIVLFFRPAARDFFAKPHPEWENDA